MKKQFLLATALIAVASLWAAPSSAQSTESSKISSLENHLSKLRAELDDLKSVKREGQGAEEAIKTSLKKSVFAWSTEDGKFSFEMNFRTQVRVTYNDERAADSEGPSDANAANASNGRDFWNFRIRRAKLSFKGNLFEKEFKYGVTLAFTAGGDDIVEAATFTWARWKEFNVNVGQAKTPGNWEEMTSSGNQQFVDRSAVNETFNQDYSKGLWFSGTIGSDTPWVKYWVGVFNGVLKGNGDFRNADVARLSDVFDGSATNRVDADLMPALRVETHPLGEVASDMVDMRDREASKKVLFAIGVAMNWLTSRISNADLRPFTASAGSGRSDTGQDTIHFIADGHLRWYGLSVNVEFHHRHTEFHNFGQKEGNNITRNRNRPGNMTDNGLSFMVGFMILPKQFDVAFRWGMIDGDEQWRGGNTNKFAGVIPDTQEMGIAVGYYLGGHNLKIQADFTYYTFQLVDFIANSPNNVITGKAFDDRSASSIANDNADWLNVWQFRVQIQWIF